MSFLIDKINSVVAKFWVKMKFSSGVLNMFTTVKVSQFIGNFNDIKLFCSFDPWWRQAVQLTVSLSPEMQSITFHCFLPRSCCITS